MKRLLPPLLFLAAAVSIIFAGDMGTGLALAGLPIALGGLLICVYHVRLFARVGTNIHTFKSPDKLVQSGLFRYTRNPIYLGFSLALMGLALSFGSLIGWLAMLAFIVISDRWYIPFEEAALHKKFAESYTRYCATTPRWIALSYKPNRADTETQ